MALTRRTLAGKVVSLLFNMLSRLVITFLSRSKCLLISWLQSPSAVILEPRKIKLSTVYTVNPSFCHEVMGQDAMILVFWKLTFKPAFSLSSFTFIKRLFSSSSLFAIRVVSSAYGQHLLDHWKKQESSRKTSISTLLTMPKPLSVWITINCGKFWKRWEYQTTWSAFRDTCMQVKKQQLELVMEQQTGSK